LDGDADLVPAQTDVVLAWNEALSRCTASTNDVQPCSGAAAFLLAVMHGAMRDGIDCAFHERDAVANDAFAAVAGASAAHVTLSAVLTAHGETWDRLLADRLVAIPDETTRSDAMVLGKRVASSWLDRYGYGSAAAAACLASSEPAPQWTRSAQPFHARLTVGSSRSPPPFFLPLGSFGQTQYSDRRRGGRRRVVDSGNPLSDCYLHDIEGQSRGSRVVARNNNWIAGVGGAIIWFAYE
jgi:hypothetical protein